VGHSVPTPKAATEDKDGLTQRLQRSPDRADALSMAFATVAACTVGTIAGVSF
jgi:hypothetical protein